MFPARRNVFAAVLLSLLLLPADVRAQAAASAQAAAAPVAKPNAADLAVAGQTITLDASSNVPHSISVEAALIPHNVAKRTFGGEVADRYALVQVTIANHNPRAAFVLETAVLDDCHWLLSGRLQVGGAAGTTGAATCPEALTYSAYDRSNTPTQISSIDARLVRGEMQDKAPFQARNWILRSAVLVGTVASGFQFLTTNSDYLSGISAYGNQFVPGLNNLWPDPTIARIDRISDFGYQSNKLVPRNASASVIAFFPLDRFLTPGLKKMYRDAPAAFFNPMEMLVDRKMQPKMLRLLRSAGALKEGEGVERVAAAFKNYEFAKRSESAKASGGDVVATMCQTSANSCKEDLFLLRLLQGVSLSNIRIFVAGVMSVDTMTVPPAVTAVRLDAGGGDPLAKGTHKVVVEGTFLESGVPAIDGGEALGVKDVKVDAASTDTKLVFTYTLDAPIAAGTPLPVVVTKKAPDGAVVASAPVRLAAPVKAPVLTAFDLKDEDAKTAAAWKAGAHTAVLTGTNLGGVTGAFLLGPGSSFAVKVTAATETAVTLTYTLSADVAANTQLQVGVTRPAKAGEPAEPPAVFQYVVPARP